MLRLLGSVSISLLLVLGTASSGSAQDDGETTLALTYAYSPRGSGDDLARGYKKHLEWHIARNDPILWYAWFVVEGERLGHFVDGAYDVTGAEFDARPDPAGDAADAIETFLPVARPEYRRVFRLRRDLSSATFLEDRSPSPLMQVVYYRVKPGGQPRFEKAASAIAAAASAEGVPFTVYEMLTGMSGPSYAMYVPLDGFRSFDNPATSLTLAARSSMPGEAAARALADLTAATLSSESEVWLYRSDLSLLPDPR